MWRMIRGHRVWITKSNVKEIKKNGFAFISGNSPSRKKMLKEFAKKHGQRWHETGTFHIVKGDLN